MNNNSIHVDLTLVFIAVAVLSSQRTEGKKKKIEKEKHIFYRQSIDKCYSTEQYSQTEKQL